MALYALTPALLAFIAAIGDQAFSTPSDIEGPIAGGAGAITIAGAAFLIGLFLWLIRYQRQSKRNEHPGDAS